MAFFGSLYLKAQSFLSEVRIEGVETNVYTNSKFSNWISLPFGSLFCRRASLHTTYTDSQLNLILLNCASYCWRPTIITCYLHLTNQQTANIELCIRVNPKLKIQTDGVKVPDMIFKLIQIKCQLFQQWRIIETLLLPQHRVTDLNNHHTDVIDINGSRTFWLLIEMHLMQVSILCVEYHEAYIKINISDKTMKLWA